MNRFRSVGFAIVGFNWGYAFSIFLHMEPSNRNAVDAFTAIVAGTVVLVALVGFDSICLKERP